MISSASLFHFTDTLDKLRSILKEGFKPHYSQENLEMFGLPNCLGIPMVSFCDIPLSQTERHSKEYGYYALGLQKKWGTKKNISPIHYIFDGSICATILSEISRKLSSGDVLCEYRCFKFNPQTALFFYAKPYKGKSSKTKKSLAFYNEREWRYVPFADPTLGIMKIPSGVQPMLSEKNYKTIEAVDSMTKKLQDHYRLTFHADDIKYIIVKKENEIPQVVDDISKNLCCSEEARKKLITRMISMKQIQEDF